MTTLATRS